MSIKIRYRSLEAIVSMREFMKQFEGRSAELDSFINQLGVYVDEAHSSFLSDTERLERRIIEEMEKK